MAVHPDATRKRGENPAPVNGRQSTGDLIHAVFARLDRIIELLDSQPAHIAFGASSMEEQLDNYPVMGAKRSIAPYRGNGGLITVPASANPMDLLPNDAGRGGLSLINTGANPATVYLARAGDAAQGGVPTGYLSANGGAWDGKISSELWCGAVSVVSVAGTTLALAVI